MLSGLRSLGNRTGGIEICVQVFCWDEALRDNLRGSRESRVGWREMLSCGNTVGLET